MRLSRTGGQVGFTGFPWGFGGVRYEPVLSEAFDVLVRGFICVLSTA